MVMNKYLVPNADVFSEMARTVNLDLVPDDKKTTLLVPALVVLRDSRYNKSVDLLVAALDFVKVVLTDADKKHCINQVMPCDMFLDLFMRLGIVSDHQTASAGDLCEIRLATFAFSEMLLPVLPENYFTHLYSAKCLPALGHMVSVFISTAESSISTPSLKIAAIRCLRVLVSPCFESLHQQVSIVILTFMPGLLSSMAGLLKLASDPRTPHNLLIESLHLFSVVVTTVLNSENAKEEPAIKAKEAFFEGCPPDGLQRLTSASILPPLPLTESHLTDIGRRISPVVGAVFSPVLFSSDETVDFRVSQWAFDCAMKILTKSARFFPPGEACRALLNCVVASLAGLKSDSDLVELEATITGLPRLGDEAEDAFLDLIRSLPSFLSGDSIKFEVNMSARLASLVGYSLLLGKSGRLPLLFSSHDCSMDLFRCVTRAYELRPLSQAALGLAPAPPSSQALAQASLNDDKFWQEEFPKQQLPFRFLETDKIRKLFRLFLETVVRQVGDSSTLISFFYETLLQITSETRTDDYRLESACFALSVMISKASPESLQLLQVPIEACVERFVLSEANNFAFNRSALTLLGICAKAASIVSKEIMLTIIRQSILAVLEACSSGKSFIENHAVHTLADLARASHAETLEIFIEENADYLANAFVLRLQHLTISRQTLYAIAAAFRFSTSGCLAFFADPLRSITSHLPTSTYDPELAELLLLAANNAVNAMLRWDLGLGDEKGELPRLEDAANDEDDDFASLTSNEKEIPVHILLARDVADAAANLFTSHEVNIKLSSMEVARVAVFIVKPATNELLPLVHRLWPGVSARLFPHEARKQINIKALDLLLSLAETSGDFIRHRFVTGMLSSFCTEIKRLCDTLVKCGIRLAIYRQTFDFKLLVRLVADLPRITNFVKISADADVERVTGAVLHAFTVSSQIGAEVDSLRKAAVDGLRLLLAEPARKECIGTQIKSAEITNPEICSLLSS